jgi:hypothetical protein
VYIYKNLKPFYQFTVPAEQVNETEATAWRHAAAGDIDAEALMLVLNDLKEKVCCTIHIFCTFLVS